MIQAITGLFAQKSRRPQEAQSGQAAQRNLPVFVIPKPVKRDIEELTGLDAAAFLQACKDYAFEIPGIVQCRLLDSLSTWLIDLGEDESTIKDFSIRQLAELADKHGGIESAPIIAEPLRAYALWLDGQAFIVMVSVGRGVKIVGVRLYDNANVDSLVADPEYFLRSAHAQGIELSEGEIQTAFAYWFDAKVTEDGLAKKPMELPEHVERDACEYLAFVTTRVGEVKAHKIRLKDDFPIELRVDPLFMLEQRHDVMHQVLEFCEGLGCTLYFYRSADRALLPLAEWVIEPSIVHALPVED